MPRLWLCCKGHTETQAKNGIEAEPPKDDDVPSYEVQVSNSEGQIWQSSHSELGKHVNVVVDASKEQMWELERDGDESWWSYHVKSNGQKLYVSYDNSNAADENVTLELVSSGKERYFVALVQPSGGFLLAEVRNDAQRVLWIKNGQLCMIPADQLSTDPSWYQTGEPFADVRQQASYRGQIISISSNEKWKSTGARPQDYISVVTSANQEWSVDANPGKWTFQTVEPQTKDESCYASGTEVSKTELMFETSVAKSNLREFSVYHDPARRGVTMQAEWNEYYVGIATEDKRLQLVENAEQAVGWQFSISRFVFPGRGGSDIIFPPPNKEKITKE